MLAGGRVPRGSVSVHGATLSGALPGDEVGPPHATRKTHLNNCKPRNVKSFERSALVQAAVGLACQRSAAGQAQKGSAALFSRPGSLNTQKTSLFSLARPPHTVLNIALGQLGDCVLMACREVQGAGGKTEFLSSI